MGYQWLGESVETMWFPGDMALEGLWYKTLHYYLLLQHRFLSPIWDYKTITSFMRNSRYDSCRKIETTISIVQTTYKFFYINILIVNS